MNNHYIVDIDGKRYLIDTGCPFSFALKQSHQVIIKGNSFHLPFGGHTDLDKTKELVGIVPDGFIGMNIISNLGLTIYKNGYLEFKANNVDGDELPLTVEPVGLFIPVTCESYNGRFLIDTGAKYGYGVSHLFKNKNSLGSVWDYNPGLGELQSLLYKLDIKVAGKDREIDVCYNQRVEMIHFSRIHALMVGNITTLFDEVCVIDPIRGKLTLK